MEINEESKSEKKGESNKDKNDEKNVSIQVDEIKIKSNFEKKLIEAFKQTKVINCHNSLSQAYIELDNYIEQIKSQKKNSIFLLNLNILDKLNRLSKRDYININIILSKIVYTLLDDSNYTILSNNSYILINFLNLCINVLDMIKLYELSYNLTKRIITFLKYLEDNSNKYLGSEQLETIKSIQKTFSEKIINNDYISFKNKYKDTILLCLSKDNFKEKEKGLFSFYSYFYKFGTLNQQFELFNEFGNVFLYSIINKPNPAYIELYYKTANLFTYFLYNFFYIVKKGDKNNKTNFNYYYLCDNMNINIDDYNDIKLDNFENIHSERNLEFLEQKKFELDIQNNFLLNNTNLISLCITLVNYLIIYESFNGQFAAFYILKRLYFIFPQYRNNIQDLLVINLVNLVSFKSEIIKNKNELCEIFLKYLLQNGEKELKEKLIIQLNSQKEKIEKNYLDENIDIIRQDEVECELLSLNDFDISVGCPMNIEIFAGYMNEKLIEIRYPDSLLCIVFNSVTLNINFHLLKFCPDLKNDIYDLQNKQFEQHQYFYEIFKLEKINCAKIILFVKNPGIYIIIFDNKYSWFNSKVITYKINVLKKIKDGDDEIKKDINNININDSENNMSNNKNNINKSKENLKEVSKIDIIL